MPKAFSLVWIASCLTIIAVALVTGCAREELKDDYEWSGSKLGENYNLVEEMKAEHLRVYTLHDKEEGQKYIVVEDLAGGGVAIHKREEREE